MTTSNKVFISWAEVFERLRPFNSSGLNVYGVPKGGMIASAFLENANVMNCPGDADVILDDIHDTGRTKAIYKKKYPNTEFHALFTKEDPKYKGKWFVMPWEADHPTGDSAEDNILRMLQCIGEDPSRSGLANTPARVVRSWQELYKGYELNPKDIVTLFDEGEGFDEVILLRDVEMFSTCEHHLLPFFGKAHIAYLPGKQLLGVSKLARILESFSRRLQIQERIGRQVTEFLMGEVGAQGAACIIEATHLCMRIRGVQKQNSIMTTSSIEGVFREDSSARAELLHLIFGSR